LFRLLHFYFWVNSTLLLFLGYGGVASVGDYYFIFGVTVTKKYLTNRERVLWRYHCPRRDEIKIIRKDLIMELGKSDLKICPKEERSSDRKPQPQRREHPYQTPAERLPAGIVAMYRDVASSIDGANVLPAGDGATIGLLDGTRAQIQDGYEGYSLLFITGAAAEAFWSEVRRREAAEHNRE
jgi:hypothetical protein